VVLGLVIFTAIVFIGRLFEAQEIWPERVSSHKEISRCPKHKKSRSLCVKLVDRLGWLLIMGGVAGECVAEGLVALSGSQFIEL
jgi:hypothetical protein